MRKPCASAPSRIARTARLRRRRPAGRRIRARSRIAIIGAGSWGTALAIQFARAGHPTVLWGRDRGHVEAIARVRRNDRYLPGAELPSNLEVDPVLKAAVAGADDVLIVVPSQAFREILETLAPFRVPRLAWATKGFELATGLLPYQVVEQVFSAELPTAVLSGPTFAREVGVGLPSALTIASRNDAYAKRLAESISTDAFRAYTSSDVAGVEVGGATKNVFAIGAGISDGLGFGANTRIALITRGLAEMTRLGLALGGRQETFMGLAGMGDLVLTCTDDQSRNRRFGLAIARGASIEAAQRAIGQVIEGLNAARAVHEVAAKVGVAMPIIEQIHKVLHEGLDPRAAVATLMRRPIGSEPG
jgi:glycerol-3-phosphate dehydrogenase (NAD(P)+)